MTVVLAAITLRQWKLHKLRTILTVIGIGLGVAVIFAVRTANVTLLGSLQLTIEKLAGKATLQITAGESGFPEEVLDLVRSTPGVKIAEPVIEVIARTAFEDEGNLLIVGVDTAGDQELREYEFDESQTDIGDPLVYLAQPDSILVSRAFAARHGLKEEDKLPLFTSRGRKDFVIRGVFKPTGIGEVFGGQIATMDVYSAQFVFNRGRNFDRVDVMTDPKVPVEEVERDLRAQLPRGIDVSRPAARGQSLENVVSAMNQGLLITSLIALIVGVFIIFNSFSIAVNQRWKEIGVLRALGVGRGNVQRMFLGEAALIGAIGSLIGIGGGLLMARVATAAVSGIAGAIYGLIATPTTPPFRADFAVEAFAIGIFASLTAAWLPARAASRLNPVLALHNIETRQREAVLSLSRISAGVALIVLGLALVRFTTPKVGVLVQFGYAALLLLGLVLMLPAMGVWIARALRPVMDRVFGSEGVLSVDTMIQAPRRTSATVGALMIGLGFVFATSAFIQGEKYVILRAMNTLVNPDLVVTTSELARSRTYHFSQEVSQRVAAIDGISRVENARFTFVPYQNDNVALISIEASGWFARIRDFLEEGDERTVRVLIPKGEAVLISENFGTRWGVGIGDHLRLETPTGTFERPVAGIVEDYSSEKGTIIMDRELYKQYWRDSNIDFIEVNLKPGADKEAVKKQIYKALLGQQRAFVYTNAEYRQWVMSLVNQFFMLNYMQMVVGMFVAALGLINTLIISVAERKREIGVIRAIGGLRSQVRKMIVLESIAIGIVGIVTGIIKGLCDTYFLTRTAAVILGGYTVPFEVPVLFILTSIPIVSVIALGAAWWPARRAARMKVIEAIGYE